METTYYGNPWYNEIPLIHVTEYRKTVAMSPADRYQWLFRRCPALIVALDKDGFFTDTSDAWIERFGYSREELTRLKPHNLATPESAQLISKEYLPMLRRTGRLL